MSRIIVTGTTGFVGGHLVKKLRSDGCHDVIGLDRAADNRRSSQKHRYVPWDYKHVFKSVQLLRPDVAIHLAEPRVQLNMGNLLENHLKALLLPAVGILDALISQPGSSMFVYLDSAATYGLASTPFMETAVPEPVGAYGVIKRSISDLVKLSSQVSQIKYIIFRTGVVFGPGQKTDMLIPGLICSLLDGKPFNLTEGGQRRDFLYIDDLITAIVRATESRDVENEIINVAAGNTVTVRDLAVTICEVLHQPLDLLKFGAKPASMREQLDHEFDITKASELLQWAPEKNLLEGLQLTVEWYRNQRDNNGITRYG